MWASWILSLMLALQPDAPWRATYEATAAAIDQVVREEPSLFTDDDIGRQKTAALLVSLAWFESNFKPNAVGGHGRVRGLYQIGGRHGDLTDPAHATRVALELLRESFRVCRARPTDERLAVYAAGGTSCGRDMSGNAVAKSRARIAKATWLMKHVPPPAPASSSVEAAGAAP